MIKIHVYAYGEIKRRGKRKKRKRGKEKWKGERDKSGKATKAEKTLESQNYQRAQIQGFLSHSKSQMIQGIDQTCRGEIHSYHEFNRGQ